MLTCKLVISEKIKYHYLRKRGGEFEQNQDSVSKKKYVCGSEGQ